MYTEFQHRQALIIGGSSGIGQAVAETLLNYGASVTVVVRNFDKLQAALSHLKQFGKVQGWQADISDRQETLHLIERIANELPNVHYLVNSAGVFLPKTFLDHSEADCDRYLNINHGTFFATQQVVRNMAQREQGGLVVQKSPERVVVKGVPNETG
ncbi:SDR family oxidoreductase [Nodosilinea sp. LEGE 07298]|uniref:SDR family NAD(P)-dependent oxidoreductase n=1 Tax=Nodosilinea sp. LEGE 07298 TaxID=2777970 RepID=UPI00187EEE8A|nr:SDR family NAD(P)-dependent oxidoreductase [Nodosilinea sp. LEGE 07298]MBE9113455.1 SDR family oxidoreductase [Nodosilinea sp. LEGE 07298]